MLFDSIWFGYCLGVPGAQRCFSWMHRERIRYIDCNGFPCFHTPYFDLDIVHTLSISILGFDGWSSPILFSFVVRNIVNLQIVAQCLWMVRLVVFPLVNGEIGCITILLQLMLAVWLEALICTVLQYSSCLCKEGWRRPCTFCLFIPYAYLRCTEESIKTCGVFPYVLWCRGCCRWDPISLCTCSSFSDLQTHHAHSAHIH